MSQSLDILMVSFQIFLLRQVTDEMREPYRS